MKSITRLKTLLKLDEAIDQAVFLVTWWSFVRWLYLLNLLDGTPVNSIGEGVSHGMVLVFGTYIILRLNGIHLAPLWGRMVYSMAFAMGPIIPSLQMASWTIMLLVCIPILIEGLAPIVADSLAYIRKGS